MPGILVGAVVKGSREFISSLPISPLSSTGELLVFSSILDVAYAMSLKTPLFTRLLNSTTSVRLKGGVWEKNELILIY